MVPLDRYKYLLDGTKCLSRLSGVASAYAQRRFNHAVFITCCFLISSLVEYPIATQIITSLSVYVYELYGSFGTGTRYAKIIKENKS
jgi:hypothetical protein